MVYWQKGEPRQATKPCVVQFSAFNVTLSPLTYQHFKLNEKKQSHHYRRYLAQIVPVIFWRAFSGHGQSCELLGDGAEDK